jgi:hypothetical protein
MKEDKDDIPDSRVRQTSFAVGALGLREGTEAVRGMSMTGNNVKDQPSHCRGDRRTVGGKELMLGFVEIQLAAEK